MGDIYWPKENFEMLLGGLKLKKILCIATSYHLFVHGARDLGTAEEESIQGNDADGSR